MSMEYCGGINHLSVAMKITITGKLLFINVPKVSEIGYIVR